MSGSPNNHLPLPFSGGVLRRMRVADLVTFQNYRSIPELGRFQGWTTLSDAEAASFLVEMSQAALFTPGEWIQIGITTSESDELMGDMGIHVSSDGSTSELGFTLAPAAQGRGLATGAVVQALRLIFACTNVTRVWGITDSRNTRSIRVLERAGFRLQESRATTFRGENCVEDTYVFMRPPQANQPATRVAGQ